MLPIFFCVVVFSFWLRYELKKSTSIVEKSKAEYLELEAKANSTRKQNINSLNYITISEKSILFIEINDDNIKNIQNSFKELSDKKILNLSGKTNTEIKAEYGPANFPALSTADENYMKLIRLLHNYADALHQTGRDKEAMEVLEYSLSIGSDMSISYKLLANLYLDNSMNEKIDSLTEMADKLTSLTKEPIKEFLLSLIR